MRKFLLDTDSVSYALRGHGDVGAQLRSHRPSEVCVSAITVAELRFGAKRKASKRLHALIDTFVDAVEVVLFDHAAAIEYGRLGNILAERGTPIGEFDVLIAAHAVSLRCVLVSNNVRHFSRVPGLVVENWT
ncbi:MAG: PIN domain-containing protein [Deltaproteobacteria bacterium]|nr:PIN domain-containing protein [Deltaproteobacteria bacterium]MBK8715506.1 PIN domain-containing protein [Deltaproteobacteria bacterium]MBP7288408.1 PIN domain-containing protein [Nannocystaceae bacterium]